MANENPSARSPASATTPAPKSSAWDWVWPTLLAIVIVKLFGVVGGLVAFGSYYWLKPKLGTGGAVAAAWVLGVVVALGFLALIR